MDELQLPSKPGTRTEKKVKMFRSKEREREKSLMLDKHASWLWQKEARKQKEGGPKEGRKGELTGKMVEGVRFLAASDHGESLSQHKSGSRRDLRVPLTCWYALSVFA